MLTISLTKRVVVVAVSLLYFPNSTGAMDPLLLLDWTVSLSMIDGDVLRLL